MRVVGCFLEYEGKIVLLLRHLHKPSGGTWGLPGGKVEEDETDIAAMLRELREETGYTASVSELEYIREDVFQLDDKNPFTFVVFRVKLLRPHTMQIESHAHQEFKWMSPGEWYALPNLIPGQHKVFELTGYSLESGTI
jgi:8-oxo-dGTP pyrophosphatase MutT (NUDIX family)